MELKRRNRVSAEFSMASMTDIIFLLLIFFMITSSAISQSAIEVKLPEASASDASAQDPAAVTISKDGKFFIKDKEIAPEDLENVLVNTFKDDKNPSFTIRADGDAKHKDVVFIMNIAEKHKYNIAIATVEETQ
ncbi:ExbD/TolR family protein [Riemerella columbipharyngis]|uniref:Biopolymer transport protein ExbD n=1 Tax=Riemerella columbipharyngis TaxID=1071918 RepID=A0A1G7AE75_9FLAO|nr:biopolymer transporter ExbD [Riemerella columbipharyngis]SDE12166.1 biopolymer transport protein ExbD [Riemerella columbipharyngis]